MVWGGSLLRCDGRSWIHIYQYTTQIGYAVYHILFVPKLEGPMDVIRIEGESRGPQRTRT